MLVNTSLVEALAAYDALEPPVSINDAAHEMRSSIDPEKRQAPALAEAAKLSGVSTLELLAEAAYSTLSKIFEDVFQGVYYQAYKELSPSEECDLLCLACQRRESGFTTDWILRELLPLRDKRALPTFERFALGPREETFSAQESVAAYVLGIKGCALWLKAPPPSNALDSPVRRAWAIIGEILFWRHAIPAGETGRRVSALWAALVGETLLAAGDVLYQLSHAGWQIGADGEPPHRSVRRFRGRGQEGRRLLSRARRTVAVIVSLHGKTERRCTAVPHRDARPAWGRSVIVDVAGTRR